jgi:hypothetical protein
VTYETIAVNESPIACDMSAIEPGLREQHIAAGKHLFRAAA